MYIMRERDRTEDAYGLLNEYADDGRNSIADAGSLFDSFFVREAKTSVIIFNWRLNNRLERKSVIT